MTDFLTTTKTVPPPVSIFWFMMMMILLACLTYMTIKCRANLIYRKTFKIIQAIQLFLLYIWYFGFSISFVNSLPFYHCRLAMFAVLFLPDNWRSKQYFALMGLSGAIFALVYPVFDPYNFPHITSLSFLVGHYALFVNSLVYLLNYYGKKLLDKKMIVLYTFVLNLFLVGINYVTGGNYGLLSRPPIIKGDSLLINYLVVSIILSAALVLFDEIFNRYEKKNFMLAKERMKP